MPGAITVPTEAWSTKNTPLWSYATNDVYEDLHLARLGQRPGIHGPHHRELLFLCFFFERVIDPRFSHWKLHRVSQIFQSRTRHAISLISSKMKKTSICSISSPIIKILFDKNPAFQNNLKGGVPILGHILLKWESFVPYRLITVGDLMTVRCHQYHNMIIILSFIESFTVRTQFSNMWTFT